MTLRSGPVDSVTFEQQRSPGARAAFVLEVGRPPGRRPTAPSFGTGSDACCKRIQIRNGLQLTGDMKKMETASKQLELSVELKDLPAQDYLGKRFTASAAAIGRGVQEAFAELYACIGAAKATPTGPPFLTAAEPVGDTMEIEVGAPCSPVPEPTADLYRGRLEACRAAVTLHRGPYEEIGPVYPRLFAWVTGHGHQPVGKAREVYLNGPDEVSTPVEYLTELMVPIA